MSATMILKPRFFLLTLFVIFSLTPPAYPWSERGHHIAGYSAAVLTDEILTADEKQKVGSFFIDRRIQLGHLNNIPDISWKDARRKGVVRINGGTHFFDADILLGVPQNGYDSDYLERVRNLETDYNKIRKQFDGKPNPLPGANQKKIDFFADVGTGPWRTNELFHLMKDAFACAKKVEDAEAAGKKHKRKSDRATFREPLRDSDKPIRKIYECKPEHTRHENIYAATQFAGILGHFVTDMAQPLHASKDYDGWAHGQGKLHHYFEGEFVQSADENLTSDTIQTARSHGENIWKRVDRNTSPANPDFAVQVMLNLTADSLSEVDRLLKLDRKHAILEEGEKLPWGSSPGKKPAKRKPVTAPEVVKAFRPLAVERLSVAAVVLSRLWVEAWRAGGRPTLADVHFISVPYPMDVPFIWPNYLDVSEMNRRIRK